MCIDMRRVIFFGGARAYAREDLKSMVLTKFKAGVIKRVLGLRNYSQSLKSVQVRALPKDN